jgi:hypothetical protein
MKDAEKKAPISAELKSIEEDESHRINTGGYNTGKLHVVSENLYIIGSYSPTNKSDYGVLRVVEHDNESGEYITHDSFYFSYPFNKVSFVNIDENTTLVLIGYSGITGPTTEAMIVKEKKLSKP